MTNLTIMKKKYKPIRVSGKRTTRQQRYFENIELKNAAERRAAQWVAEREGMTCITYEIEKQKKIKTKGWGKLHLEYPKF